MWILKTDTISLRLFLKISRTAPSPPPPTHPHVKLNNRLICFLCKESRSSESSRVCLTLPSYTGNSQSINLCFQLDLRASRLPRPAFNTFPLTVAHPQSQRAEQLLATWWCPAIIILGSFSPLLPHRGVSDHFSFLLACSFFQKLI
jgi:hypothetical protein